MMLIYIYDGSFEGLLTAIYDAYYRKEKPESILDREPPIRSLFAEYLKIETEPEKSAKVYRAVQEKIGPEAVANLYYAYLSEIPDAATWIYHYLDLGWQKRKKLHLHWHDDRVKRILDLSRKVRGEKHRLLGLVRFQKLPGDIYYAPIEPDYNILGLISPHFAKRLADQNWIIHDLKREIASFYNQQEWVLSELSELPSVKDEAKDVFQELWKKYFQTISIPNRLNPKLQRRFMPARYWKYLPEME